jgi:predicted dehydrogenase
MDPLAPRALPRCRQVHANRFNDEVQQIMKVLKLGIIGQGRSGRDIHAEFLRQIPQKFQIAAVADVLPDRAERARTEYGCAAFTDYRQLLTQRDLDLIVNATPSHLHVPVTKEFLQAGFNVLCEKPLARQPAEVDELIASARRAGKLLAIFQQSRFAPYYRQVCAVLESGVLGRIALIKCAFNGFGRRYDWQTLQSHNGGNLLNTGPHPLDQVLGLIGRDLMPGVWCQMDRLNTAGDAEDYCKVILSAPGRPTIDLEVCSNTPYPSSTYDIYGQFGGLRGDMGKVTWKYYVPAEVPALPLQRDPLPGPSYCSDPGLTWHEHEWTVPAADQDLFGSMAARFYDNLYEALVNGAPLVIPPEHVRQQIAVIAECHRQNPLSRLPA